jgi:DNA helicase-4
MLLLAFNNDAAAELRERIKSRLEPLGLPAEKIVAKTFHAFGLDVIGQATGKRPSLAPWLDNGRDLETLLDLVDNLKDKDNTFRENWDLFRVVLGQDLPKFGQEHESPDSWDSATRTQGFWTLNGEVVKSRGEQIIANWLFYNGVNYQYEAAYQIETADETYSQYHPDFYFPEIDVYLEHWAVDEHGNPPPKFLRYREGMAWKKKVHTENQTTLLETTMAGLWSGEALRYLATQLTKRGIVLAPNPERPALGRKPIENPRLARTFRAFLTHAKSNRLTMVELRSRLESGLAGNFRYRHHIFLGLFEQLWGAWEEKLKREKSIDFEDMLGLAADCIEQDRWKSPYELVMVDEFQDASQARSRLVSGLLQEPGKCLFAVGDDWQSINRFAGSDLAVMTEFESTFGRTVTLKLENTYRCPQSLCDISSSFVQKNPKQIRKKVRSAKPDVPKPVSIIQVADESKIRAAVTKRINEIATDHPRNGKRLNIYVLGRYNKEREYLPLQFDESRVSVEFITVHSSKGLEADHVILPRMTDEALGFPSRIADDPVLQLAMPGGDSFENAEERRLFYVALTRAKASVTLITLSHKASPFVAELVTDHKLEVFNSEGVNTASEVCPTCKEGFLVRRKGKYGTFLGCSRFPRCRHSQKILIGNQRPATNCKITHQSANDC